MKYGFFLNENYQGFIDFSKMNMRSRLEKEIGHKMMNVFNNAKEARAFQRKSLSKWLTDYPNFVSLDMLEQGNEFIHANINLAGQVRSTKKKIAVGLDWTIPHKRSDFFAVKNVIKEPTKSEKKTTTKQEAQAKVERTLVKKEVPKSTTSRTDFKGNDSSKVGRPAMMFVCAFVTNDKASEFRSKLNSKEANVVRYALRRDNVLNNNNEIYVGAIQLGKPMKASELASILDCPVEGLKSKDESLVTGLFANLERQAKEGQTKCFANFDIHELANRYLQINNGEIKGSQADIMVYTDGSGDFERNSGTASFVVRDNINHKEYARALTTNYRDSIELETIAIATAIEFLKDKKLNHEQIIIVVDSDSSLIDLNNYITHNRCKARPTKYLAQLLNGFDGNLKFRLVKGHQNVYGNILADGIHYFVNE